MAAERKLIISQKDSQRNIIMTDSNPTDSVEDLKSKLIKLMGSKRICTLQTQDDLLIFKPSQISSIMVSSKGEFGKIESVAEETDFIDELADAEESVDSDYVDTLSFNEESDD